MLGVRCESPAQPGTVGYCREVAPRKLSRKDIRELLEAVKAGGWTVDDPIGNSNIYKAKCKCGHHLEHIHSTPSGSNYVKNKFAHMRAACWEEDN